MSTRYRCRFSLMVLTAVLAATGWSSAQEAPGTRDEAEVAIAAVELDGAAVLRVRGISSFPAQERAGLIRERLAAVAADRSIPVESLRIVESASASRIVAGDQPILAVTEADASLEQIPRADLAAVHVMRIGQAIAEYRRARTASALWQSAFNVLIATLVLIVTIVLLSWLWRRLDGLLRNRLRARIHTVGIQSFEVMRAEQIWTALRSATLALRTAAVLAISLVYLGFVLAQFPWTRGLSRDMVGFALRPLEVIAGGIVAHIPSLVFLIVLFFVFRLALRLVRLFFDALERGAVTLANFDPEWAQPTYKIVRVAVIAFGLIVAYPYIPGSESDAFKGVSLFIGIVFSLGSSSAISNIIAGYMMTYRRAFKVGDRIRIGDAVGDVIQTRLQVTHLRSYKNEELIIPNSQILGSEVLNYSSLARAHGLILHTEVGIGYETPWRQVEAMLLLAAERTPGLAAEPPPFVLHKKLGDFAVTYELNVYCTDVQAMNQLYTALHRNILDVFNEFGVQIMTPAYEGDPNEPKVVPREAWYASPATGPAGPPVGRNTVPAS